MKTTYKHGTFKYGQCGECLSESTKNSPVFIGMDFGKEDHTTEIVMVYQDGVACNHPGCLNHVSHPCEGCGRVSGKGNVIIPKHIYDSLDCLKKT